jgi:hypothetical protein
VSAPSLIALSTASEVMQLAAFLYNNYNPHQPMRFQSSVEWVRLLVTMANAVTRTLLPSGVRIPPLHPPLLISTSQHATVPA